MAREVLPQLRRGALEYCVLALMQAEPRYGFDLVRELGAADGLLTSEGTIYPLLSRLRKDGLVSTTWQESDAGPPRRYYALTADGQAALARFVSDWQRFRDSVDRLLGCVPARSGPEAEASIKAPGSPTTTGPTTTGPTATGPITPGPITTGPTATGPITPGPITTGPTATGPTATGPITPGPTTGGSR